jgi:hypothetical protein
MVAPRKFDNLRIKDLLELSDGSYRQHWNNTRGLMVSNAKNTPGAGYASEFNGIGMARDRILLHEDFTLVPQLSAVTQAPAADTYTTAALLANLKANHNFEVLGTNAVSADVAGGAEGGITVSTHGANNDSTIILPHLTAGQSAWTTVTWGSDRQVRWECAFSTGSSVASINIWAGLKLTNTPTVATDDDQVYFNFNTAASASATYWHAIASIGGTDVDSALTSIAAVAASTRYHLVIDVDSTRVARFYVNGPLVYTSAALTDAVDFKPYFGVKALTGAVKTANLYKLRASRNVGATG